MNSGELIYLFLLCLMAVPVTYLALYCIVAVVRRFALGCRYLKANNGDWEAANLGIENCELEARVVAGRWNP